MTATPAPSLPAHAPDRVLAAAYTGTCAALLVASALTSDRVATALRALIGILAVLALLRKARRAPRIGTNPWLCLAAGISLAVSAATVASIARIADATPPLWSSWLAFAGYVVLGIGFLILDASPSTPRVAPRSSTAR